jgi:hypothetical protein
MDSGLTAPALTRQSGRLQTVAGIPPNRFLRPTPGLALIGVLSPLMGLETDPIHLASESTIGRDETCSIRLRDQLVSRHHARITRDGEAFEIEDMGSVNGTFVDGVPVVRCQLHDGDTVQVGRTLFYFDRLYVRAAEPLVESPAEYEQS